MAQLPLEDLELWGKTFVITVHEGDPAKITHMLESLELTARLWAVPAYRALDTVEGEVIALDSMATTEPETVDLDSFVVQMHAEHGAPLLRNHMKDGFPEVS